MATELIIDREGQPAGEGLIRIKQDGVELMSVRFRGEDVYLTGYLMDAGQKWLSAKKGK